MFDLRLLKIRAFSAGIAAALLASIARGGLQFMLIIWLQGIWLPLHGYNFIDTPLWSGIYLLPLTVGFLCRRAAVRLAVRPVRRPLLRLRRAAGLGRGVRRAAAAPDELQLPAPSRS